MPFLPASLSSHNDIQVLIELQTATVCLVDRGAPVKETMTNLYRYLGEAQIEYPSPTSEVGRALWQVSVDRATPAKCKQILSVFNSFDNI